MTIDKLLQIVPRYDGKGNAIEWLYKFEAGVEVLNLDFESIIPFIILFLSEEAYTWYSSVLNYTIFEDYEDFRHKLIEWFTPSEEHILTSLSSIKFDPSIGFKKYILNLAERFCLLKHLMEDTPKIQWFIRGLPKVWQAYFLSKGFIKYQDLCYFAITLDERKDNDQPPLPKDESINDSRRHSSFDPMTEKLKLKDSKPISVFHPIDSFKDKIEKINNNNKNEIIKESLLKEALAKPRPKNTRTKSVSLLTTEFSSIPTETEDNSDESFNSINIKKLPSNPRSLSLVCKLNGYRVVALFYPLSFKASISIKCIQRLKAKGFNIDTSSLTCNEDLSKEGENILGEVDLVLSFDTNIHCKANFLVMKNQSSDILLGDRFMKTHFIQLDFSLRRIIFTSTPTRPTSAVSAQLREGLFF
ncbi:hypothetical protein K502DRAFT_329225 [Neoconidiobolus thromboides FSU 785]|nr:hypothetical protein K502DRAFT_329225 [Neoconidiobolus thromboides FSU 785]